MNMVCKHCGAELVYEVTKGVWLDRIGSSMCSPGHPDENGLYRAHKAEKLPSITEVIERLQEIVVDLS